LHRPLEPLWGCSKYCGPFLIFRIVDLTDALKWFQSAYGGLKPLLFILLLNAGDESEIKGVGPANCLNFIFSCEIFDLLPKIV
jgi:hypothetical protein